MPNKKTKRKTVRKQTVKVVVRPSKTVNRPRSRPTGPVLKLQECTLAYALAIGSPWDQRALLSCVPISSGMTMKATGFLRGTGNVGTSGFGYIVVSPSLARDAPQVWMSDASFAATVLTLVKNDGSRSTGATAWAVGNLPFTGAELLGGAIAVQNPPVSGRIVSCGIRVWYIGREQDLSGEVFSMRDPAHSSLQVGTLGAIAGPVTFSEKRDCRITNFNRRQVEISDFAADAIETEIDGNAHRNRWRDDASSETNAIYPFCNGGSLLVSPDGGGHVLVGGGCNIGYPTVGHLIVSTPGAPFGFEVILHVEYVGAASAVGASRTHADVVGTQAVLEAANSAQTLSSGANGPSLSTRLYSALSSAQAAAREYAVPAGQFAGAAAQAYASRQRAVRGELR